MKSPEAPDQAGLDDGSVADARVAGEARPPPPGSSSSQDEPATIIGSAFMAAKHGQSLPHLQTGEVTLLDYAADDSRDVVTLSDKEALVLQLYNQIQEQQLEKAFLEQGTISWNF